MHEKLGLNDVERIPLEDGMSWIPIRRTLGITGFSVNGYSAAEAGDTVIETHNETGSGSGGHEELYLVTSRRDDALDHLRPAIEGESHCAEWAREDSDFDSLREDPEFVKLVS